jgi:hypothetical protein
MRQTKRVVSLAAMVLLAACTDNGIFNPDSQVSGTYQLTVFAGRRPPATFTIQPGDPNYPDYPNGASLAVTDGSIVLQSDRSFVETDNYLVTPNGESSRTVVLTRVGTWTLSGEDLRLDFPPQNNLSSFSDFGTLTVDLDGRYTIDYEEADGFGGFDSYEYKR